MKRPVKRPVKAANTFHSRKPAQFLLGSILALPALPGRAAPLVTDGLKGYWSFDTDTGAAVAETSGAAGGPYNGNMVGTPAYSTSVPPGFGGQSADMTAPGTGVIVSTPSDPNVGGGAINAYFDPAVNPGSAYSVSYWTTGRVPEMWTGWVNKDGEGSGGFRIISVGGANMGIGMRNNLDSCWNTPTILSPAQTNWVHYAITYGGGFCRIYQNGIKIAEQSRSGSLGRTTGALTFGCTSVGGGTEGAPGTFARIRLDEVYFFDRPLTPAEVITLYGAMTWDGGTGNWADSNWSGGNAPAAGRNMAIDINPGSVTLDADFSANSLLLGMSNASSLTINTGRTLTAADYVSAGSSGTLQVDGTLTANTFINSGSSTFSPGSVLSFSGANSVLSLTGGTLTYDSTTPATPATVKFYPGGGLAGSGSVNATTRYEVWGNATVTAHLHGATTALDVIANATATLTGTNTYGGQTSVKGGARLNFVPGVGLPDGSNLKIEDNSTAAWSGDLIRPGGTGPGQMQVQARHAHSAFGGPARLGFGTRVGDVITLENLIWNSGSFNHSEGWYLQRSDATDPLEVMNPIDLATGGGTKPRAIFIQSGTQPVTFSGVLSGTDGALRLSQDFGTSTSATLILTARNTYTGNTLIQRGTLILADNAELRFVTGDTAGVNNTLTGNGTAVLDGDFCIDTALTDASALVTGTWQLENMPSVAGAYGATFQVVDVSSTPWTNAGNEKWTRTAGGKSYTFDETTGTLTLGEFVELRFTSIVRNPDTGHVTLTFTSTDPATYKVEATTDLAEWFELEDSVDGQAGETTYTDADFAINPVLKEVVFYRVTQNP